MRRALFFLSALLLVPGWLLAAETVSTAPSVAGSQPAPAVHPATKKKAMGQAASKAPTPKKGNWTVSKPSSARAHHRGK